MASQTTHGLPYPQGTDKVRDGDNAIQALAEAVDAKLPWGQTRAWAHTCADARVDILDFSGASVAGMFTRNADATVTVLRGGIWSVTNTINVAAGAGAAGIVALLIKTGAGGANTMAHNTGYTAGGSVYQCAVSWTGLLAANDILTCQIYPRLAGALNLRSTFAFVTGS